MLLLFVVSGLLEVSAWGHVQAFTPLFLEQALGVSRADVPRWTGILAGGPLAIALLLTPLWGILADRYGSKIIILRALFVEAVAYGLVALTQDVWQLLGVRMLVGLTFGGQSIVIATIANLVPARRVGFSIGIYQMTYPVGMAIGPLLGSGLIGLVGLRGMFAVDALVAFTAFSLVWRLFRETPRRRESSAGVFKHLATLAGVVWQTSSIRIIFGLFFLLAGGHALITPFLPVLIGSVYQGDNLALTIGLILAGYGTLAGVGAPLAGRLTDRLGPARTVTFTMAGLGLMSVGLMFVTTPLQVALVVLLGAVPFGASTTVLYASLAGVISREQMTPIMALTPMARFSAMLVTPLIGAAVSGFGLWAIFATSAAVYAIGTALCLALLRDRGRTLK